MATVGPRNMVHSWATDMDDPTVQPRWGKIGKQKIEDAGTLYPGANGDGRRRDPRQCAQVRRQGAGRQQAVLPLAEPDPHARRHAPLRQVRSDAQLGEWLERAGSRHGATRRHRRLGHEVREGQWPRRTTPSSPSPPTTAPRTSPGPTAARRHSPAARERLWKAASACRPSSAGRARCRRARSRTASCPGSTGSRPSSPRPAIPNIVDELKAGKQLGDTDLQGPSRRLQPDGPDHRQGPVEAARDLLLHRKHALGRAHRRLQVSLHRSAERLAWRAP